MLIEQFIAGNMCRGKMCQRLVGIQKINTLARLCLRRVLYDSINTIVSAKSGERVIIPGPFKIIQGRFEIRERKLAIAHPKLQFGILRINGGSLFIFFDKRGRKNHRTTASAMPS